MDLCCDTKGADLAFIFLLIFSLFSVPNTRRRWALACELLPYIDDTRSGETLPLPRITAAVDVGAGASSDAAPLGLDKRTR